MSGPGIGRIYGALLWILPEAFRRRYAAEMRRMFEEQWAESGVLRRMVMVVRALRDIAWTALAVRLCPGHTLAPRRRGDGMTSGLAADLRLAVRGLRRRPGFTVMAAVTIGLGIGAMTAVFSVVDATVLHGLRVPEPDRLISIWSRFADQPGDFELSPAEFTDVRSDVRSLELVGGYGFGEITLEPLDDGVARTAVVARPIGDLYELLGARAVLGRLPGPEDDRIGAPLVAVLTHGFWMEAFGGDPGVVGTRTLPLGNSGAQIIGVLAPEVALPEGDADAWVHQVLNPESWVSDRSGHWVSTLARLRAGVSEESARAELASLERTWAERYAGMHTIGAHGHATGVMSLSARILGPTRRIAILLSMAAGLLLLLACANVANLLLARGETRTSEVGVRVALGASRARVARPVMLEGLVLGVLGGILGVPLARFGMPLLLQIAPPDIAQLAGVGVDARVVAFAVAVSLATGALFGLVPALSAARRDPAALLRSSGRGRTGATRGLRLLVAGQTALATVLLALAGLLTRSLFELNSVHPGLDPRGRITLDLTVPPARFSDAPSVLGFYDAAQQRVQELPGIERAALVRNLPLRDGQRREYVAREQAAGREERTGVTVQLASPGALGTLGIRLFEGREFQNADRTDAPLVALVNRSAARALWPDESALGRRVRALFAPPDHGLITIVGVYEDVRSESLGATPEPEIILPFNQVPGFLGAIRSATVVIQSGSAPATVIPAARQAIRAINASVPVETATTMAEVVRASSSRERFIASLLGVFAGLALVIAAVGVFGVVSFSVARQTREFAIRNALGAGRSTILGGVLRKNVSVAAAGAMAGAILALLAAPGLRSFLYNVAPRDPLIMAGVPLMLIVVAMLSSLAPALRATRVSPARALQESD